MFWRKARRLDYSGTETQTSRHVIATALEARLMFCLLADVLCRRTPCVYLAWAKPG